MTAHSIILLVSLHPSKKSFLSCNKLVLKNCLNIDTETLPPNIEDLKLESCDIQSLDDLHLTPNIKILNLRSNQISSLTNTEIMMSLPELYIGGNQLTDISAISILVNLQVLQLWSNQLTDITSPAKLAFQSIYTNLTLQKTKSKAFSHQQIYKNLLVQFFIKTKYVISSHCQICWDQRNQIMKTIKYRILMLFLVCVS
ncbi:leucine-rich_repeat domain-containing protein [Hexamita inflata]|uniref:Leucine-rich repeat domain-containing protein n=1 Tax=Hexamita inflata TaxID=28002 RepID=A0AA86P441_9EUKA|nr:leucine-rich repeat domain-containing protein [Hexamita inflata]